MQIRKVVAVLAVVVFAQPAFAETACGQVIYAED